jgi:hypothetical protein
MLYAIFLKGIISTVMEDTARSIPSLLIITNIVNSNPYRDLIRSVTRTHALSRTIRRRW